MLAQQAHLLDSTVDGVEVGISVAKAQKRMANARRQSAVGTTLQLLVLCRLFTIISISIDVSLVARMMMCPSRGVRVQRHTPQRGSAATTDKTTAPRSRSCLGHRDAATCAAPLRNAAKEPVRKYSSTVLCYGPRVFFSHRSTEMATLRREKATGGDDVVPLDDAVVRIATPSPITHAR